MDRRTLLRGAALGTFSPASFADAQARPVNDAGLDAAIKKFGSLAPEGTAVCLSVRSEGGNQRYTLSPDQPLFVGSALKTFILARYLKDIEAGRLSESEQVKVGPEVWSPGSSVLINLQGTTTAKSVLEAMIAHSDNTATDIAINAVTPERVRALIKDSGLLKTRMPDSTRKLFSYLYGAPNGTDVGWDGMKKMLEGVPSGNLRSPMNDQQTMLSTAGEMTQWYEQVLEGKYFQQDKTLREFKRISAMADAIPAMVPEDTAAYGKGGSIDWGDFHCFSVAGQMVLPASRVSFCFIVNWHGNDETIPTVFASFVKQGQEMLKRVAGR